MNFSIETLQQIVQCLPRHTLKSLLPLQPHPLGQVASYVFFSTLSIHFGVRCSHDLHLITLQERELMSTNYELELTNWHAKRSYEILTNIIGGSDFARRIRRLKIYAPGSTGSDQLVSEMILLKAALPKLTSLKSLEYDGLLFPFKTIIVSLSIIIPHLESLRLMDCVTPGQKVILPSDTQIRHLPHLNCLALCQGWYSNLSHRDLPKNLADSKLNRIHMMVLSTEILSRCITPAFTSTLSHLSLTINGIGVISPFEIALQHGANLRSLRIRGALEPSVQSIYFRRYINALPYLTEFGIYIYGSNIRRRHWADKDFFPAICDFIRPKEAQFVHLELVVYDTSDQKQLGFDEHKSCWDLFKETVGHRRKAQAGRFQMLESLSMTLPPGRKKFSLHFARLLPKGMKTLSLSDSKLFSKFRKIFAVSRDKARPPTWPPELRLVRLDTSGNCQLEMVQAIAECIPTVRVVKVVYGAWRVGGFWSVSRLVNEGRAESSQDVESRVLCKKWSVREQVALREETLDQHECQDTWFEDFK